MSYIQRKQGYANGIRNFLRKNGFDVTGNGSKENAIMVAFLREKGLQYKRWNRRYKGLNTANLVNAETVQNNWNSFQKWVITNKDHSIGV